MSVRTVRLLVLLSLLLSGLGALTTSATARSSYVVTATASKTTLVLGQAVTFSGSVSPRAAGKTVTLQKRYKTTEPWTNERTATIASDGTFRISDRPTSLKPRWYRVKKAASGSIAAGYSSSTKVLVYKWHYLTDLDYVDKRYVDKVDSTSINGEVYKKTVRGYFYDDPGFIEYNLSRKCSTLRGVYGIEDSARTGASLDIEVLGDGNSLYQRTFQLGVSEAKSLNVSNFLRIRFEYTRVAQNEGGRIAIGSPRVLCRF